MNIPRELIEQVGRGNGIVFVGDGLSQQAGLPAWANLIRQLAGELDGCPADADPRDIAQYYEIDHGRNRLVRRLRDHMEALDPSPTVAHEALAHLPVKVIFTTNYDHLLEKAVDAAGRRATTVVGNADTTFWSTDRLQLVKLHGDLHQPDSMLITADDYERFAIRCKSLADILKVMLQTRTVLFLGYAAADPNLRLILAQVSEESGSMARRLYTVQFDPPRLVARDLERRGLSVVDLGPRATDAERCAALADWLRALGQRARAVAPTPERVQPPRPPLKSVLPLLRGPFVGRDRELGELMARLRRYESPLIIDGAAGMGKSSLATAVAHACAEEGLFDAFVWWSARYEPERVVALLDEIGRTLGYPTDAGISTYDSPQGTYELLGHYRCLLVVTKITQNQHGEILEFLRGVPPTTCVLITTTSPLPMGTHVEAAPLDLPTALELLRAVAHYLQCPSILAASDEQLLPLCKVSGGSPVALDLAVGLAKQGLDLDQIVRRLETGAGRFSVLCADAYSLLPEPAQHALNLVCISRESISRQALEQILDSLWCPQDGVQQLQDEDWLQPLKNAWLVIEQRGEGEADRRLAPANRLVRDYYNAAIKITQPEDDQRLRDAMAAYYHEQCQVKGYENWSGYDWIDANLSELLATLEWYDQTNQWTSLVAMAQALYYCLGTRGYWRARLKWGDRAGQAARQLGDRQSEAEILVRVIGWTESYLGDYAKATEDIQRGLAIFEELDDHGGQASAYRYLGTIRRRQGDLEGAESLYRRAQHHAGLAPPPHSERLRAGILVSLSILHLKAGRLKDCQQHLEEALHLYQELGHEPKVAEVQSRLASVRLEQGQIDEAECLYQDSEARARTVNVVKTRGYNLLGLARIANRRGQVAIARDYAEQAEEIFGALGLGDADREIAALLPSKRA